MTSPAPRRDPWLLTPGPLTTSATVKQAMLHDWGSRDHEFIAINRRLREKLVALAGGTGTHVCVPMQGSGTFAVEAMIGSFVPATGKLLILINGAYGKRIARISDYYRRAHTVLEWPEDRPVDPAAVEKALAGDPAISHVAVVHCETTSGVLNPIAEVAAVVARAGRRLLVEFHERLRGLARRCPRDRLRCGRGLLQQMPRRRARHGLRHLPERSARSLQGQFALALPRSFRSVAGPGEDRAMALHPTDSLHRRLRPGGPGA